MENTNQKVRKELYFNYLTTCVHKQGKIEPNTEQQANKLIKDLTKAIESANEMNIETGVTSPFDIGSYNSGFKLYRLLQDKGICGVLSPFTIDTHEFYNKAFVFYLDFLRNSEFFKSNEAQGNAVVNHTDNVLVNICANKLLKNRNLVLTGAPGTGKTHLAKEIANAINAKTKFVQFHPSYDYTDFVEGLRPMQKDDSEISFERKDGVFKSFCKEALSTTENYVMIIDEINRGEISKILGDLFFAIDPGYRGEKGRVDTQYQNLIQPDDIFFDGFYVPENVYIIATMNDIDRSVESMDFAIRRRFAWKDVRYTDTMYNIIESVLALNELASHIYKRMENLNNAILNSEFGLSSAYQIGAAYFKKIENYEEVTDVNQKFNSLWDDHIYGVLFEYMRGSEDPEDNLAKLKEAYDLIVSYDSNGNILSAEDTYEVIEAQTSEQNDNE